MGFTEREQAILSQLAYMDFNVSEESPLSLYDALTNEEYRSYLESELGDNFKEDLEALTDKVKGQGYYIVKSVDDDDDSGFVAFAIEDPNHDVTVVCRGSEDLSKLFEGNKDSRKDFGTDLQLLFEKEADQHGEMEKFIDDLNDMGYDSYYFTGHSLGGNLAIHGSIYIGDPDKVKGVTTFNSPGFNDYYWVDHHLRIDQLEDKINNYENEFDVVSAFFTKPGTTHFIETEVSGLKAFDHHSICNFKVDQGDFKKTDKKGPVAKGIIGVSNVVDFGFWALRIIYESNDGAGFGGYRDFSQRALKNLTAAARETQDEPWWRVDRWDCWYRLADSFFPVNDFLLLTGNVDAYYKKLIDINDASVTDIERIFEKVYQLDDTYAAKIMEATTQLQSSVQNKLEELASSVTPSSDVTIMFP